MNALRASHPQLLLPEAHMQKCETVFICTACRTRRTYSSWTNSPKRCEIIHSKYEIEPRWKTQHFIVHTNKKRQNRKCGSGPTMTEQEYSYSDLYTYLAASACHEEHGIKCHTSLVASPHRAKHMPTGILTAEVVKIVIARDSS